MRGEPSIPLVSRRRFLGGLSALVAAPAVIRIEGLLMPISSRFVPAYVPVLWLLDEGVKPSLRAHSFAEPKGEHWINVNDYDPFFARAWAERLVAEFDREQGLRADAWAGPLLAEIEREQATLRL